MPHTAIPTAAQIDADIASAEAALAQLNDIKSQLPPPVAETVTRAEDWVGHEVKVVVQAPQFSWIAKTLRTLVQVLASGAVVAAVKLAAPVVPTADLAAIGAALTPAMTAAQNLLEDKGLIGHWLSKPPAPPAVMLVGVTPRAAA